jgi:hypothetical protein
MEPDVRTPVIGAVYLSGETASVRLIDQPTPFEVSGPASIVSGMLQASNPSERIFVQVLYAEGADDPRPVTTARGRTILLGEHLLRDSSRFIRTAP